MRKSSSTLALTIGMTIAAPAAAQSWEYVARGSGVTVYVDAGSTSRTGEVVRFWMRHVFQPVDTSEAEPIDTITAFMEVNCADRSDMVLQSRNSLGGRTVRTFGRERPKYSEPGSLMASVVRKVCGN